MKLPFTIAILRIYTGLCGVLYGLCAIRWLLIPSTRNALPDNNLFLAVGAMAAVAVFLGATTWGLGKMVKWAAVLTILVPSASLVVLWVSSGCPQEIAFDRAFMAIFTTLAFVAGVASVWPQFVGGYPQAKIEGSAHHAHS
jgi:hypothetical protein